MNAKEMFEELGYNVYKEYDHLICYGEEDEDHYYERIHFDKRFHSIGIKDEVDYHNLSKLVRAINKQIEELEWLESEE